MITPAFLQPSDKIEIVAPAGKIDLAAVKAGARQLTDWGFSVSISLLPNQNFGSLAGTDAQRLSALQQAIDDPATKAIVFARGGYGVTRLLDQLDFSGLMAHPKWLVGFSDLTALHSQVNNLGISSIHGPMAVGLSAKTDAESLQMLRHLLLGTFPNIGYKHSAGIKGKATGELVGGNLTLLANQLGTASDLDTQGKILFMEEVSEYRYQIDRLMVQLDRANKLAGLAGLVVGSFSDLKPNPDNEFPLSVEEIITEKVAKYGFPVAFGFPAGHTEKNVPLVLGQRIDLEVTAQQVLLTYEAATAV